MAYDDKTKNRQKKERERHPDRVKYRTYRSRARNYIRVCQEAIDQDLDIGDNDIKADVTALIKELTEFKETL